MSDPISVAGTAVGITSLGIQVCQALVRYYVQFRSYHDDIDALVQRVEHLENILRALDTVKKKVELDNDEVSQKLQLATKACKEALGSLERTVKKFTEIKLPDAWEDRLRLVKKRLLWPFKKDALMNTQDILDKLQANLLLALQILGIDVENRHFESISSSTNALAQQSDRIETQLNIQAQVLQSIHGNFHTSSSSQRDQLSNLTSHMTNLSSQSAQLCLQMDKVVQRLELVTCDDGSPQDPSQLAPSLLANIIDTSRDLNPAFRRTLRKYKKSIHKMGQLTSSVVSSCTCHLFTRTRERRTIGLYFSKVSRQTFDHLITCPYFPHANFSHTVEAQFNHCAQLLGFCVRAGFVHARQAGWRTVYPTLRFRTVVSYYSPIFTPFERANHWIRAYELWQRANLGYQPMSAEQIETLPGFILSEVTHNLGNRARPSDKLPDGDTVLHVGSTARFFTSFTF
ncbi:hypothetical protein K432DRAFT_311474 [Lepidopterella palustris CBS 459.81]|uniref:Azaphilone pigments biosynthesis cluster protein L N-terminal domain-containing protein n=1 Tax=Lepidopterella palustris CBS 459.81 TaxID=1314670 RepID=A0A8E2DYR2_9PEZI|nr:hypothetical protein K432DRAFT_311474 [Lepidopterella palustris CBS 459.81]